MQYSPVDEGLFGDSSKSLRVVSKADGSFEIENLPVGEELEFQLWHEKGGYLDEFTLGGKKASAKRGRIDFTVEEGGTDLGDIVVDAKMFN